MKFWTELVIHDGQKNATLDNTFIGCLAIGPEKAASAIKGFLDYLGLSTANTGK